ncbi:MAG: VOC family protein [Candidatus Melainabacteria bacterium]|jgi:extradiol dioxygenase family protein
MSDQSIIPKVLFHLAFPVGNIEDTKSFYLDGLGCTAGRESIASIIVNFHDNQLVAHVVKEPLIKQIGIYPRHFGLIFTQEDQWFELAERAEKQRLNFYQSPKLRFEGKLIEHRTMFLEDPFYNLLEFKFYRNYEAIFGGQEYAEIGDPEG